MWTGSWRCFAISWKVVKRKKEREREREREKSINSVQRDEKVIEKVKNWINGVKMWVRKLRRLKQEQSSQVKKRKEW